MLLYTCLHLCMKQSRYAWDNCKSYTNNNQQTQQDQARVLQNRERTAWSHLSLCVGSQVPASVSGSLPQSWPDQVPPHLLLRPPDRQVSVSMWEKNRKGLWLGKGVDRDTLMPVSFLQWTGSIFKKWSHFLSLFPHKICTGKCYEGWEQPGAPPQSWERCSFSSRHPLPVIDQGQQPLQPDMEPDPEPHPEPCSQQPSNSLQWRNPHEKQMSPPCSEIFLIYYLEIPEYPARKFIT